MKSKLVPVRNKPEYVLLIPQLLGECKMRFSGLRGMGLQRPKSGCEWRVRESSDFAVDLAAGLDIDDQQIRFLNEKENSKASNTSRALIGALQRV